MLSSTPACKKKTSIHSHGSPWQDPVWHEATDHHGSTASHTVAARLHLQQPCPACAEAEDAIFLRALHGLLEDIQHALSASMERVGKSGHGWSNVRRTLELLQLLKRWRFGSYPLVIDWEIEEIAQNQRMEMFKYHFRFNCDYISDCLACSGLWSSQRQYMFVWSMMPRIVTLPKYT